ncbi:MAG: hypothetical protein VX335_02665, partial [Pseudomonadota bacterium]|nr:hypothetical protein [Pseudomonadota bacterium]
SDSNTKNNIVFNPDDLCWVFDKVITHKAIDNQKKHEILKGIIENLIECSPTDSREDIGYNIDLVLNIATLAILRDKEDILYHILTNFLGYIKSRGADCSYYFEPLVLGLIVRAHNWGLPNIILSLYNKYYFDFTDIKNKHYYLPIDLQDLENSILRIRSSFSETTIDCIIEHAKKIHNISKCALEKLTDLHKESIKDPLKMELLQQNLRKIMNGEVIEGFNSELISLLDLIVNIPEIKLNGTDDKLNKLLKYLFFKDESLFFALSHLSKKDFFDIDLDLTKAKSELIALQDKQKRSLDNPNEVKITTGLENTGVNNNSQQEIFPGHEEEMTEYPREKKRSLSIEQDSATIIKTGENDVLNGGAINENKPGPELGKKTHLSLFGGTGYEEEKQSNINNNFTEIIDLTGSDKNSYNTSDNSSPITIASSPENSEVYNSHQNSENIEKTTPNIHEATVKENRNSFFHNSSGNTYTIIDSEDEYNTASEGEDSMTHS